MTEETKSAISSITDSTKLHVWKYFGAMIMESKDGVQAVSLTRVLAIVLFISLLWKWSGFAVHPEVSEYMIYTFWGLIGLKGVQGITGSVLNKGDSSE